MPKDVVALVDAAAPGTALSPGLRALVEGWGAQLTVATLTMLPDIDPSGLGDDARSAHQQLVAALSQGAQAAAETAGQAVAGMRGAEVRPLTGDFATILRDLTPIARLADLLLVPADGGSADQSVRDRMIDALLASAACPLLVLPKAIAPLPWAHAVLSWNGSKAVSRAWRDAVPLLAPGGRVDVVLGGRAADPPAPSRQAGADVARHLGRQGFAAAVHVLPIHTAGQERRLPAEVLWAFIAGNRPDLLVMGGDFHADPGDSNLTGLVPDMIRRTETPLLLSR